MEWLVRLPDDLLIVNISDETHRIYCSDQHLSRALTRGGWEAWHQIREHPATRQVARCFGNDQRTIALVDMSMTVRDGWSLPVPEGNMSPHLPGSLAIPREALAEIAAQFPAPPPPETEALPPAVRRCWECGRLFTAADARRNGGKWEDSYCGC